MLQKLNERIQGVVAWFVILLIALTFVLFGLDYYMRSHESNDVELLVNHVPITKEALDLQYQRARQQQNPDELTVNSDKILKKQVLDELISQKISVQGANKWGFEITPAQANATILNIPEFQEEGHFSTERYQKVLRTAMFTPQGFQEEVMQGMLLNQQRFAFIATAFVLPDEIKRFVDLYLQRRNYQYVYIKPEAFMDEVMVSDEDMNDFYKKNTQRFIEPEKVSLDFIRLSMQGLREKIAIKKSTIQRYYKENQASFQIPAQWKVAHILVAIPPSATEEEKQAALDKITKTYDAVAKNNALFSQMVQKISDDQLAANNGGELPWIKAGQTPFDPALLTLTDKTPISKPLLTEKGYEIFKLIAKKDAIQKPLAEVQASIVNQLTAEKAQKQYTLLLEQLTDLTYQTPDSLEAAANALQLPVEKTELFSMKGGDTPLTQNKAIIQAAFSHEVLGLGNNSEPIQLDDNTMVVIRVNQHVPAVKKPLESVKPLIRQWVVRQKAIDKSKTFALDLLKKPLSEQNAVLNARHFDWIIVTDTLREGEHADSFVNETAFSLLKPSDEIVQANERGIYFVVRLNKIDKGQYDALDKEHQDSIMQQVEATYGLMDYDLYIKQLTAQAKIIYN